MPLIGATASISRAIKLTPFDRKLNRMFQMLDGRQRAETLEDHGLGKRFDLETYDRKLRGGRMLTQRESRIFLKNTSS